MIKYLLVGLLIITCLTLSVLSVGGSTSSIITLPDGSSYDISCTLTGVTLVCDITKVSGKDLSHWVIDLGACNEAVIDTDPPSAFTANDPTTGVTGWKFEPITDQTATYTLTLDAIYATGSVTATMKAGTIGNYASGLVEGPNCAMLDPTSTTTDTPTPVETFTPTPIATNTPVETSTSTSTPTATLTPEPIGSTSSPTETPTSTSTATETVSEPFVPTDTSTPTPSASSGTETATDESTSTPTPTITIESLPTLTPIPTSSPNATLEGPTGEIEEEEPVKNRVFMPILISGR